MTPDPNQLWAEKADAPHKTGVRRYRRKPTFVLAVQLNWASWNAVCEFVGELINEANPGYTIPEEEVSDTCGEIAPYIGLNLPTMHGDMTKFRHGDWIIPDGKPGTFYPCKPEVFAATYEVMSDD